MSKERSGKIEIVSCGNFYKVNCELPFFDLEEALDFIRNNLRVPPELNKKNERKSKSSEALQYTPVGS